MKCPTCGAENPDHAYFCGSCGYQFKSAVKPEPGPVSDLGAHEEPSPSPPDAAAAKPEPPGLEPVAAPLAPETTPAAPESPAAPEAAAPEVEPGTPKVEAATPAPEPAPKPVPKPAPEPVPPAAPAAPAAPEPPARDLLSTPIPTEPAPPPPPGPQDSYAPGAGITPPAPGAVPPPPPPGQYAQPPVPGAAPPYYGRQAYPGYGYMPPDGNTSGMGEGYLVPPHASGWTFAGFVPFGLFGFINGVTVWGVVGLVGHFIGLLSIIYWIYIGLQGKELAWKHRRFDSIQQYEETMRAWNTWGLVMFLVGVGFIALYIMFVFAVMSMALSGAGSY